MVQLLCLFIHFQIPNLTWKLEIALDLILLILAQVMVRWFDKLWWDDLTKSYRVNYHSNETLLAELLHGSIYFLRFHQTKFGIFGDFFALATLGVKRLITSGQLQKFSEDSRNCF